MRRAACLAIVLGCAGAAGAAQAQSGLTARGEAAVRADLAGAAFAPKPAPTSLDRVDRFDWRSAQVTLAGKPGGAIDSVRLNLGQPVAGARLDPERSPEAFDVTLIRSWPGAVSFASGDLDVDFTPHAGVGVSSLGGQAEAGGMIRIGRTREDRAVEQLKDMGVREGIEFGDRGRWYLFAAASGRAVGLNMLRDDRGWDRGGWTTDATGALIGDAHVGVGFRKGDLQTSFGVIHREVRGQHMIFGQHTEQDTVAAFSFSIRPQK